MNRFKKHFFFLPVLLLSGLNAYSQAGPDWGKIVTETHDLMKKNHVHEVHILSYEDSLPLAYYHEIYDDEGFLSASFDYSFANYGDKTRLYYTKYDLIYFEDSLFVTVYQPDQNSPERPKVTDSSFQHYIDDLPGNWKKQYSQTYRRRENTFYKQTEDTLIFDKKGKLIEVRKPFEGEMKPQKKFYYDKNLLVREETFKPTKKGEFYKESETYYAYTPFGKTDSVYTLNLANYSGIPDTAVTDGTKYIYDDKERLLEEIHTKKGFLLGKLVYDYSLNNGDSYSITAYDRRGTVLEVREFTKEALQTSTLLYDRSYSQNKVKQRTTFEYVFY